MSNEQIDGLNQAIEGLLCFVCTEKPTQAERDKAISGLVALRNALPEVAMERCPSCHGRGEWETECCNGSGGCDCRGQVVPMGRCNVCHGEGQIRSDHQGVNLNANCDSIRGLCYIGRGPRYGRIG